MVARFGYGLRTVSKYEGDRGLRCSLGYLVIEEEYGY